MAFGGGGEGGYRVLRRITNIPSGAWTVLNFRQADWFGACPQLTDAERTRAMVVGQLRTMNMRLVDGTYVRVAEVRESERGGDLDAVVGDKYNSVDANSRVMSLKFGGWLDASVVYWRSSAGTEDVEVEAIFDLPVEV